MENLIIYAEITATSKKQGEDFKQEVPTKTAYLKTDSRSAKSLEDFGLTQYTSKDGDPFFAVKFVKNLVAYQGTESDLKPMDFSESAGIETNNFKTVDGVPVGLNIIKGENKGNVFYRIQALLVEDMKSLEEVKPTNPFAM